jgi:hypothetical protein
MITIVAHVHASFLKQENNPAATANLIYYVDYNTFTLM